MATTEIKVCLPSLGAYVRPCAASCVWAGEWICAHLYKYVLNAKTHKRVELFH